MKLLNLTKQESGILRNCNPLNSLYDMEVYVIIKEKNIRRTKWN